MSVLTFSNRTATLYRATARPSGGGEGPKQFTADATATGVPCGIQEGSASITPRFAQPVMVTSHTMYVEKAYYPDLRVRAGDKWVDDLGRTFRAEGWFDSAGSQDCWVCPCDEIDTFTT